MRCYIRNGVTTVRFAGVDLASVSDLRERSAEAGRPVPGILNLGPMIDREPVCLAAVGSGRGWLG